MKDEEEIEFVGWTDQQGYMWQKKEAAAQYYGNDPYSLRPTYAVIHGKKEFNGY